MCSTAARTRLNTTPKWPSPVNIDQVTVVWDIVDLRAADRRTAKALARRFLDATGHRPRATGHRPRKSGLWETSRPPTTPDSRGRTPGSSRSWWPPSTGWPPRYPTPPQCGGTAAVSSDHSFIAIAFCCRSRSDCRPSSFSRSDGSRSNLSSTAAGSGCGGWADFRSGLRRPAWGRTAAGGSPARMRLRTSHAVAGETSASRATSRSEACGFSARTAAARHRPSTPLSGRTLPSRPTRALSCGAASAVRWRREAAALAPRPEVRAMARSDRCGCDATIRAAAARRSFSDSGSPCAVFASTARRKASSAVPSKNSTSMVSDPLSA